MLTVSDIEDKLVDLTDHVNLGAARTRSWINMVSAEFAARLAGSDVTGMAVATYQAMTTTTWWTSSSATGIGWAGAFVQNGVVAATQDWVTLGVQTGMAWPSDALYINRVFHASTTTTQLMDTAGTNTRKGVFQQQYLRSQPGDLCRALSGYPATYSITSGNTVSSIYYAAAGAIFASGNSSSYARQNLVWPMPYGTTCYAMIEYVPAPTPFSSGAGDDGKSNVWMSKYPDVFLNGVLRYAWLYLGHVENYMRSKQAWEDGIAKLAGTSRSFANQTVVGGQADHDHIKYVRG